MNSDLDRPFLVGDNVYLRPFDLDDLDGDYIQWKNDYENIQLLSSNSFPTTKAELLSYVTEVLNSSDQILLAIIEKSSGKHFYSVK
tara:strand:- start:3944 stop:4201 length:258 start_codon:yes stop_codon:yes gene_type:complete